MAQAPHPWLPIATRRLLIRDFRAADFADVHIYGSDPEVSRYMPWGPNTPDDTRAFLGRALAAQASWPRLDFGLAIEHAGAVAGSIGLHLRDWASRTVEIGYCLRRDLWGRGIVTEAARAVVGVGFGALRLHRIVATCDVRNAGSFAVMEKLGMRREGRLRLDRQCKGEWRDTYLYALLAEEWTGGGTHMTDQGETGETGAVES